MLDELQTEIWYTLCEMSGEDVALMFTNYYGDKVLNKEFKEFLIGEGRMYDGED